jgi:hypothetical protein
MSHTIIPCNINIVTYYLYQNIVTYYCMHDTVELAALVCTRCNTPTLGLLKGKGCYLAHGHEFRILLQIPCFLSKSNTNIEDVGYYALVV